MLGLVLWGDSFSLRVCDASQDDTMGRSIGKVLEMMLALRK